MRFWGDSNNKSHQGWDVSIKNLKSYHDFYILHENSVHYISAKWKSVMLKNITLSADENLIKKARLRSRKQNTTLNAEFRKWLKRYSMDNSNARNFDLIMEQFDYVKSGKHFSREELNAR